IEALKGAFQLLAKPIVSCQAKTIKHLIVFAPLHDRFPSKTPVSPYDNANFLAKTPAKSRHDLLECFKAGIASVAFTIPQLGKQRNVTAKTVKRQLARNWLRSESSCSCSESACTVSLTSFCRQDGRFEHQYSGFAAR